MKDRITERARVREKDREKNREREREREREKRERERKERERGKGNKMCISPRVLPLISSGNNSETTNQVTGPKPKE